MRKINYIILLITVLSSLFSYGQDGRSLILVHNYADKDAIDAIANPSDGNIAYNATDKSFYLYDEDNSKWIADCYYKAITTTTGALTLDEDHYTVIVTAPGGDITLPNVADYNQREYVIKNTTSDTITITDYLDNTNSPSQEIPAESVLKVQSDGADWHQVNNYATICSSGTGTSSVTGLSPTDGSTPNDPSNINNIQIAETSGDGTFTIQFQGPATGTPRFINYEILVDNIPYQLTGINAGDHTYEEVNNLDGTFDYLFTATSPLGQYNTFRQITTTTTPPTTTGCNCVSFHILP